MRRYLGQVISAGSGICSPKSQTTISIRRFKPPFFQHPTSFIRMSSTRGQPRMLHYIHDLSDPDPPGRSILISSPFLVSMLTVHRYYCFSSSRPRYFFWFSRSTSVTSPIWELRRQSREAESKFSIIHTGSSPSTTRLPSLSCNQTPLPALDSQSYRGPLSP